jgi:hypothetical protein
MLHMPDIVPQIQFCLHIKEIMINGMVKKPSNTL